jgi:aspartyl-tRNA(Asn)/glutamyl-tRNA(Gln) amidotransferase subunit A
MTWTVRDNATILASIAGYDPDDPNSAEHPVPNYVEDIDTDIRGKRIGIIRHFFDGDITAEQEVKAGVEQAATEFEKLGGIVEEVRLSPLQDYTSACWIILSSEAYAVHEVQIRSRLYDFCEDFRTKVLSGGMFRAVDYVQAQRQRRSLTKEMLATLADYDALLCATVPITPPRIDRMEAGKAISFRPPTSAFSLTGLPVLALCCGFTPSGFPLSISLIGSPFDEGTLFSLGEAYEQATPWRARRPPI